MLEVRLSAALVEKLRSDLFNAIVFKHADSLTAGIPDISVTFQRKTVWLEVKVARPAVKDREVQRLRMKQLFNAGENAFYVVYDLQRNQTIICTPAQYKRRYHTKDQDAESLRWNRGVDHGLVVSFIRDLA